MEQNLAPSSSTLSEQSKKELDQPSDLLSQYKDAPCRLRKITFDKPLNTKPWVIEPYLQPCFDSTTFQELLLNLHSVTTELTKLNVFDRFEIILDTPPSSSKLKSKSSISSSPKEPWIDIKIKAYEKSRFLLNAGTEVGNQEGHVRGTLHLRNMFGQLESLRLDCAFGTRTQSSFETLFTKPSLRSPLTTTFQALLQQTHQVHSYASYESLIRSMAFHYHWPSSLGQHTLRYDLSWRQIFNVAETASKFVRHDAGHSLKSCIVHSITKDTRDHASVPTKGYLYQLETELAGLGGNVKHLKNQLSLQGNLPLSPYGHSLSASFKFSHLVSLDDSFPKINDRIFFGGPSSLRGFKWNSVGPRDENTALGGTIGYQLGISLFSPVPKLTQYPWLRSHVFLNAGSLAYHVKDLSWPSVSSGIGFLLKHPTYRLELNWHIPLILRSNEAFQPGFGFGIGLEFL